MTTKSSVSGQDPYGFRARFRNASVEELVQAFNDDVGKPGWVSARGSFHVALREAFLATGLDCSSFIGAEQRSGSVGGRIRLEGRRLVTIADTARSRPPAQALFDDGLSLADKKDVVIAALRSKAPNADGLCAELFDQLVESGMDLDHIEVGSIVEWDELDRDGRPAAIRDKISAGLESSEATFYRLLDLRDSKGRRAYLVGLSSGEGEELNWRFVGIFLSLRKAKAAVRRVGIVSFGQRRPS